jgi:hypothetical protein
MGLGKKRKAPQLRGVEPFQWAIRRIHSGRLLDVGRGNQWVNSEYQYIPENRFVNSFDKLVFWAIL